MSITGPNSYGISSAAEWTLYNRRDAPTSRWLLPGTDPIGSGYMIHLTSTANTGDTGESFFNGLQAASRCGRAPRPRWTSSR